MSRKKAWIGTLEQTRFRTEVVYAHTIEEARAVFEKLADEATAENCSEPDWSVNNDLRVYEGTDGEES